MTVPDERRPTERRSLELLVADQTRALDEARTALEDVVPELRRENRRNLIIAVVGIIAVVLFAAAVGIALWALGDALSAGSHADANQASAQALAAATRNANLESCRAGNDYRSGQHAMWAFAIDAFRAGATDPNELKVLDADQRLNDRTNALRNCEAMFPPPTVHHRARPRP